MLFTPRVNRFADSVLVLPEINSVTASILFIFVFCLLFVIVVNVFVYYYRDKQTTKPILASTINFNKLYNCSVLDVVDVCYRSVKLLGNLLSVVALDEHKL